MIDPSSFSSITAQIDYGELAMPLTAKGEKVMKNMVRQYGEKGKSIFYASANKGTITGVHEGEIPEGVMETLRLRERQLRRQPKVK